MDDRSPEERVVEQVGEDAYELLPAVKAIVDSVYQADPPLYNVRSVAEMGDAVERFLCERHPELSAAPINAVVNNFAFDWK
jgi:hypothetical protein